jgi:hypothetical protein
MNTLTKIHSAGSFMNGSLLATVILTATLALRTVATPVPLNGDIPVPLDHLRPGNPAVLSMAGSWRFKLEHDASPAVNGQMPAPTNEAVESFATTDLDEQEWKDIPVPANWEIEGFSRPTFQNRGREGALAFRRRVRRRGGFCQRPARRLSRKRLHGVRH